MSKTNPITAVDIEQHPCGTFFVVRVERGLVEHGPLSSTFAKSKSYHVSDWRHTKQHAQLLLNRARRMQDVLFNRIQFKEKTK